MDAAITGHVPADTRDRQIFRHDPCVPGAQIAFVNKSGCGKKITGLPEIPG
jgi:hypothetical protein